MLNPELTDEDAAQAFLNKLMLDPVSQSVIIQLMTFDEVNTRIDQPLYSPKMKVLNCFII